MPFDLNRFKIAYAKWVEESLPDYRAGKMQETIPDFLSRIKTAGVDVLFLVPV